ncbi:alpha/beta hydrolase [Flavisphingomonas formosensis]|uniref:alpha/beta hydrolase n=1 Tax=Flavisphingomonas formosensis TaxID=861534 RepID=UPI0012F83C9E|nr:alpha/beta hydrolase [Sphingomonas formosensis]
MTDLSLVDPELRPVLETFPVFALSKEGLPALREGMKQMQAMLPVPEGALQPEERFVPGPAGAPDVRVLIYRPKDAAGALPAIFHIHGGGYVMGTPEMMAAEHRELAPALGCVIVTVDYRLAPDVQHPAPIEDCYAALKWTYDNAASLGIDPKRIGVSGESAGGGLAAALALLARDRGEVPLAFQHLIYPMIDDRTCTTADPHPHAGEHIWTAESNVFGWTSLLGKAPGGPDVDPYAAAARATDLAGLPPTYLAVGALDLFLDEDLDYALRLTRAGVPVELHVYPGAYHGFQAAPEARVTLTAKRDSWDALARFLKG